MKIQMPLVLENSINVQVIKVDNNIVHLKTKEGVTFISTIETGVDKLTEFVNSDTFIIVNPDGTFAAIAKEDISEKPAVKQTSSTPGINTKLKYSEM